MEKISLKDTVISKMEIQDIEEVIHMQSIKNENVISKVNISHEINDDKYITLVMKYNGRIIAFIQVTFVLDTMDIQGILVDKDYTRQGVASYLLKHVMSNYNVHEIFLEVRKSNIIAQKLYEKFGFVHISTRPNYYPDNNEDALIYMAKI